MGRYAWIFAAGTGWMLGSALQTLQASLALPGWRWAAGPAGLIAAALAAGLARRWLGRRWAFVALLLALGGGAALGWALTEARAAARLAEALAPELEGADLQVVGVISGLPVRRAEGLRFPFEIEAAWRRGRALAVPGELPAHASVGWYREAESGGGSAWAVDELPRAGQRWRFTLRLRRPHGSLNPNGVDYELWMFEQGLRATGTVRDSPGLREADQPLRLGVAGFAPMRAIEQARQAWRDALWREVGDRPAAGVLAALAVGDQAAIDRSDWEVFRLTGVAHLVAISGLHVTLWAWLCGRGIGWLWRRSRRAMHVLPAPRAAQWGGLLAALVYALLAGWGVPAQRTVLMLAVATLLRSGGWRWPGPLVLWATAWVVLAFDPWALWQAGFWLSFVAVALLMGSDRFGVAAAPGGVGERAAWADPGSDAAEQGDPADAGTSVAASRRWAGLRRWGAAAFDALRAGWRSQWVASVGLAPWTLLCFQQVSLVGLLANAWAIPLVTLAITPLALAGLVWAPLWTLGAALIEAMMAALEVMARWPGASWSAAVAPLWCQAAALAGALLLVGPLPGRLRVWGVLLMLPMLAPPLDRPADGEFELLAADVGQGTAVLLRTRGHTLLYDAGPRYSADAEAGSRLLAPLAQAEGVGRLDLLLLSHRDGDHIGGASALLRQPGAWRLLSSLETMHPLRASVPHQPCVAGQVWVWDDVRFEILHPREREYERASQRLLPSNGLSCVLRVQGRRAAALLTGDIEREQEERLVSDHADARLDLRADVLLVPHHGSRTSSSESFLNAVQPRIAVAQLGWRNRYGHPAAEVEARYRNRGIAWLRTDHCGAWRWRSDEAPNAFGRCERALRPHYWHVPNWGGGLELAKDPAFTPTIP